LRLGPNIGISHETNSNGDGRMGTSSLPCSPMEVSNGKTPIFEFSSIEKDEIFPWKSSKKSWGYLYGTPP